MKPSALKPTKGASPSTTEPSARTRHTASQQARTGAKAVRHEGDDPSAAGVVTRAKLGAAQQSRARQIALNSKRRKTDDDEPAPPVAQREPSDAVPSAAPPETSLASQYSEALALTADMPPDDIPARLLPAFLEMAQRGGEEPEVQKHGVVMLRKLLSSNDPPIDQAVELGAVGVLRTIVESSGTRDDASLLFETLWALTNISSGSSENTRRVIDSGVVPATVALLEDSCTDVIEQAVWMLGNIAGDSAQCRDYVLSLGAMPLLAQVGSRSDLGLSVLRNTMWAVANLMRSKPQPAVDAIRPALPLVASMVYSSDDEIMADALWALSYLTDGPNERIEVMLQLGVIPRVVECLAHPASSVITAAVRTVGNCLTGNERQTQTVINAGFLSYVPTLLNHPKRAIRKETCWALSNITAGGIEQIQAVINANLIPALITMVGAMELEVKREAVWALSNVTSSGSREQVTYLIDAGCVAAFLQPLDLYDAKIVAIALEGLENLLLAGAEFAMAAGGGAANRVVQLVHEAEGLRRLELLQSHSVAEVYQQATDIMETYFDSDASLEDGTTLPGDARRLEGDNIIAP